MSKRKLIGLLLPDPESVYQQRILDGVTAQCGRYGYDCAVFSPLMRVCHNYREYLSGELNIFELINFERLDGVIVPTISLSENQDCAVRDAMLEKVSAECSKPIAAVDLPFGDYPIVETDDRTAFSVITEHILDVHKCDPDKIYFLTGMEGYDVSERRLGGFADLFKDRGIEIKEDNIFYGDFWYSGGERLADRIISGEVPIPQAVVCASDHMAIGLANRLSENGINVPKEVIVTGYDATAEAVINSISITTYVPDVSAAAAKAVNIVHNAIEPDVPEMELPDFPGSGLRICSSCGCPENIAYIRSRLTNSLYNINHNYINGKMTGDVDIGVLLESYMMETLTSADSVEDCMAKIAQSEYLVRPYKRLYLCLNENWLDTSRGDEVGAYSDRMRTVVSSFPEDTADRSRNYCGNTSDHSFDTSLMLPELDEECDEPSVFYFSPLHFNSKSLGYSVFQCGVNQGHKINTVFRNWIRYVNNALEMMTIREELKKFSERDAMTGLYNRRKLSEWENRVRENAKPNDNIIVFVIDMDGLKYINDTFGHNEGDYGIKAIAAAVSSVTRNNEICIRAGGDEFYIIGIGDYSGMDAIIRSERLSLSFAEVNKSAEKPYEISASIGYSLNLFSSGISLGDAIKDADKKMYENKTARKKQRVN